MAPIVRTQFVTTHNNIGFARKKAQIISFIEREFERLGLGHRARVSRLVCTKLGHVRSRSLSPGGELGGSGFWPFFPAPLPDCLFLLLYLPVLLILRPHVGSTFPRLILVPSAHTQSGWEWL